MVGPALTEVAHELEDRWVPTEVTQAVGGGEDDADGGLTWVELRTLGGDDPFVYRVQVHSIHPATLRRMPKSETTVMLATVIVTVTTHNLAIGVVVGVLVAMTLFARRVTHLTETHREILENPDGTTSAVYTVTGELFFASSNDLYTQFEYVADPDRVVIDLSKSHIWDASTVAALDAITTKYERNGKAVEIIGLNDASAERHGRLTGELPSH